MQPVFRPAGFVRGGLPATLPTLATSSITQRERAAQMCNENETTEERETDHRATYCPEDNKLRLYPDWSDPEFDKEEAKAVGYRWASKQECYVCPRWTIAANDYALDFVDVIEDENYSPAERAADRAERFEGYRDNRRRDAHGHADRFEGSDAAIGHQNARRANRAARRRDRAGVLAGSQWSKAEYWQQRTRGVIDHAIGRESPEKRRRRIKKLETAQRHTMKSQNEAAKRMADFAKLAEMEGNDVLLPLSDDGYAVPGEMNLAGKLAYLLCGQSSSYTRIPHPTDEAANEYAAGLHSEGVWSLWDLLTDEHYGHGENRREFQRLTPGEVARAYLDTFTDPMAADSYRTRWAEHYERRLEYERAMLANEGGSATDIEFEVGGHVGSHQIHRVNKSNASGKVVSLGLWGAHPWRKGKDGAPEMGVRAVNIESMGADIDYKPPTDEDRAKLKAFKAEQRKTAKETGPVKPKLLNPTPDEAERIQKILNSKRRTISYQDATPPTVETMTQKVYSANSKGTYRKCEAVGITEKLEISNPSYYGGTNQPGQVVVFRIRMHSGRVIVLEDKKQHELPWAKCDEVRAAWGTRLQAIESVDWFSTESHGKRRSELSKEAEDVFQRLRYHGLAKDSSSSQWGLTDTARSQNAARRLSWVLENIDSDSPDVEKWRQACQIYGLLSHEIGADKYPKPETPLRITEVGERLLIEIPQLNGPYPRESELSTATA